MSGGQEFPSEYARQYEAWGIVVKTGSVRAAHIANGIVQLLRTLPNPPAWRGLQPPEYLAAVRVALEVRFQGTGWRLPQEAHALCVTEDKYGHLALDGRPRDATDKQRRPKPPPSFYPVGLEFIRQRFQIGNEPRGALMDPAMHRVIARALNADGRVYADGGEDPTTTGLAFAGMTAPKTLDGMHAATFLGLLSSTPPGRKALLSLYDLLRSSDDPHSQLVGALRIARQEASLTPPVTEQSVCDAFPMPSGSGWDRLAESTSLLTSNLLDWGHHGLSKAETLMAVVDLAHLLLVLRMLRWPGAASEEGARPPRLLLMSPTRRDSAASAAVRALSACAERSLERAKSALDDLSQRLGLVRETESESYRPGRQALNLAAAGGWVFPLDARGGARRYLCPGPRQLTTLVYALVPHGQSRTWSDFADAAAAELGLAIGGAEHERAAQVGVPGAVGALRTAAERFRNMLVALGLARQESDNVVIVDGGLR